MKTYVLFNGLSGNGTGKEKAEAAMEIWKNRDPIFTDITTVSSYEDYFDHINYPVDRTALHAV